MQQTKCNIRKQYDSGVSQAANNAGNLAAEERTGEGYTIEFRLRQSCLDTTIAVSF